MFEMFKLLFVPNLKVIGPQITFLLPTCKLNQTSLHFINSYFEEHRLSYTIELSDAYGLWHSDSKEPMADESTKYVCGLKKQSVKSFIEFLSNVCFMMKEDAIYVTIGGYSCLVFPKEKYQ